MLLDSHAELARWGAAAVRESFASYQAEFKHISRRAKQRFEQRDWRGAQSDALERLGLRDRCIAQAVEELRGVLGAAASDPFLRAQMKSAYARDLSDRPDPELAKTFFNSVTRRIFGTVGVNPDAEFVTSDVEPQPAPGGAPIFRTYLRQSTLAELVETILRDFPFASPFRDLPGDARLAAAEIDAHLRADEDPQPVEAVEMLKPVFYRGKGAYLVGRLRRGGAVSPLILPLL